MSETQVNQLDILVQRCGSAAAKGHHAWSEVASFIEVKKSSADDLRDQIIVQCLRYVRKLFQYNLITSHLHFVTCCGPLTRLWYIDSQVLASSRAFDMRSESEEVRLTLGRRLRLVTLESCQDTLF